jgi:penicillin-binding protein 2
MKNKDIFKKLVYLEGGTRKWQVASSKTSDSERWLQHILPADAEAPNIENDRKSSTFLVVIGLSLFAVVLLVGQLLNLQMAQGKASLAEAEGNRVKERVIRAPRGIIYDAKGVPLVKNVPNYDLSITPSDLPLDKTQKDDVIRKTAEIAGVKYEDIRSKITTDNEHSPSAILVLKNLDKDKSILLESKVTDLPGVRLDVNPIREYLDNGLLSQTMGYVGRISETELAKNTGYSGTDYIGKSGLEKEYESILRGTAGKERVEVNSTGANEKSLGTVDPIPGQNVRLSIDFELQKTLVAEMQAQMAKAKINNAAAVAINPQNGQVLAMVSLPTYDNNLFAKGISEANYASLLNNPDKPLLARVTSGEYPSGSTIKPFVAAGALEEGTITESTTVNSTGGIKVGDFSFPDWKAGGHGVTNVLKAIAESVNTFFYAIGGGYGGITGLGPEKIKTYLDKFGFDAYTNIDVGGEAKGSIPDPDWKLRTFNEPWYLGDTYHMAIGQGDVLVTPLQMGNATSAIANGGTLYQPTLVASILDGNGNVTSNIEPKILKKDFIKASTIDVVQRGMRQTITAGSGRIMNTLVKAVAGKTGTAQYGPNESKQHAWFITYGPIEKPTIAMSILLEGAGGGDVYAAPVANGVYKWYFANR